MADQEVPPTTSAAPATSPSPPAAPAVDIDDHDSTSDVDSAYGDELASFTTSLNTSIQNHVYENGRRYHAYESGRYFGPNDEAESDRLDMASHLSTLILGGKLFLAPIKNLQRVLDLGTGTGIWAIEMGDEHPSAEILGIDLSPTQPSMVPPNVRFEIDDIEKPWTFHDNFDLIHSRFMAAAIADWPVYVAQAYKHTRPGGWCEFKDFDFSTTTPDDSLPENSYIVMCHENTKKCCEVLGREYSPGPKLKERVEAAGYENVTEIVVPVPVGIWPRDRKLKEIGAWNYTILNEGLEAICMRMWTAVLGMTADEVVVILAKMRSEMRDKRIHFQYAYHIVYGQKPGAAEAA
ncbi:methyltransferase domain-containing protein [Phlyctema vagabunda]|uniref:Methyltransferase domain-containing protein n=1 Tax=Phlyctema vagabunda TaxID=108571 RepID=A0ABR4PMA9_9HELO